MHSLETVLIINRQQMLGINSWCESCRNHFALHPLLDAILCDAGASA